MIPKYAPADLGLLSIAPQSGIVKHTKFDHVLDTIFCAFWTESVHRELGIKKRNLPEYFKVLACKFSF